VKARVDGAALSSFVALLGYFRFDRLVISESGWSNSSCKPGPRRDVKGFGPEKNPAPVIEVDFS